MTQSSLPRSAAAGRLAARSTETAARRPAPGFGLHREGGLPAHAADPLKLLVVDDSLDLQRSIATLLSPIRGLRIVGHAEDVAGALERVERLRPDLVLLDVALRGQDRGIDVLRRVVREHARIRVVVLSNFSWRALRDGLLDAGAHACFDKGTGFMQARDWIAAMAQSHAEGPRPGAC